MLPFHDAETWVLLSPTLVHVTAIVGCVVTVPTRLVMVMIGAKAPGKSGTLVTIETVKVLFADANGELCRSDAFVTGFYHTYSIY
jgi:hypothetical protein